jgi:hypothetical protein
MIGKICGSGAQMPVFGDGFTGACVKGKRLFSDHKDWWSVQKKPTSNCAFWPKKA